MTFLFQSTYEIAECLIFSLLGIGLCLPYAGYIIVKLMHSIL
jgi:hypothetical protein